MARREHSRLELQRKLKARGHDAAEVSGVLDELAERHLQSDERYVEVYVRSRAARGYGPQRIALELKQRGLAVEVVRAARLRIAAAALSTLGRPISGVP